MTSSRPAATVHIGVEKTGSTYIQQMLSENADALDRGGFGYPTFLGKYNHHALAAYAVDARLRQDIHRWNKVTSQNQRAYRSDLQRQLRAAVTSSAHTHWLFTCEHLSSRLVTQVSVDRCVDLLRGSGLEPRVLAFLRPQEDMIESSFSTSVISGATSPFHLEEAIADRARYDYAAMIERWELAVGHQNVTMFEYHRGQAASALAEIFCDAVGIDVATLRLPALRANASISYAQAELLRLFNQAAEQTPRLLKNINTNRLRERLREVEGPPFSLGPEERQRVRDAYRECNRQIAERYDVHLSSSDETASAATQRAQGFTHEDVSAFLKALAASARPAGRPPRRGPAPKPYPTTSGDFADDKRRSWLSPIFRRIQRSLG